MFKGWAGFKFVGGYAIPIIFCLVSIYYSIGDKNYITLCWEITSIFWIIVSFLQAIRIKFQHELIIQMGVHITKEFIKNVAKEDIRNK